MPFYEYQCSACGAQTEVLQKITDAPLRKCPECGKNKLTKLVSAPVFRLKGGGWYETDFKSDKDNKRNLVEPDRDTGGNDAKAEKSDSAGGDKDSSAKTETKAESKPEPAPAKPASKAAASSKPAARPAAKKPAAKSAGARKKR